MDNRLFFIFAAILQIVAFVIYNIKTQKGNAGPNPASWAVWAFLAGMNAFTYSAMTDWVSSLQFFAGTVGCMVTFFLTWLTGKFTKLSFREVIIVFVCWVSMFVYYIYRNAEYANLIVLLGFIVSAEPTIRSVWKNPQKEPFISWFLWAIAFSLSTYAIYQTQVGMVKIMGPIYFFLFHALVAGLSLRKRSG